VILVIALFAVFFWNTLSLLKFEISAPWNKF
jgi:hypothetical protein